MDPGQMLDQHMESGAGVTVAGIRMPRGEASRSGSSRPMSPAADHRLPREAGRPAGDPDNPNESYVSMGNYIFTTDVLVEALKIDAGDEGSVHDMGGNIIPMLTAQGLAHVYDFSDNEVPGVTERDRGYWRDVGSLDAYHDAHMDLVSVHPVFNLYNRKWPILTTLPPLPPASSRSAATPTSRWSARGRSSPVATYGSRCSPSTSAWRKGVRGGAVLMPGGGSAATPSSDGRSSTSTSTSRTAYRSESTSNAIVSASR